jgi:acyl-coenzyme A thioesterase PaaI-like protein
MKVLNLPFSKKNNIIKSDVEGYLLMMPFSEKLVNHIGTLHGSASFALAEITSGYFLNINFSDIAEQTIPILRGSTVKYKKITSSTLYSKAKLKGTTISDLLLLLQFKRKVLFSIEVKLYDEQGQLVVSSEFEWFVSMK